MPLGKWTLDQVFNQLNYGIKWGGLTITFSFPTNANSTTAPLIGKAGFTALGSDAQAASRLAVMLWDDLIAPDFVETVAGTNYSATDLEFGFYTGEGYASANYPGLGSIYFNASNNDPRDGTNLTSPIIGRHVS